MEDKEDPLDIFDWKRAEKVQINDEKGEVVESITPEEQLYRIYEKRLSNIKRENIRFASEICLACKHKLQLHEETEDITLPGGKCSSNGCACPGFILGIL